MGRKPIGKKKEPSLFDVPDVHVAGRSLLLTAEQLAAEMNAGKVPGLGPATVATVVDEKTINLSAQLAKPAENVVLPAERKRQRVKLVEVPTRRLVDFTFAELATAKLLHVRGAIVRVTGDVPAQERDALDLAALRAYLVDAGAVAVMLQPRYVGAATTDERRERVAGAADPEAAVVAWFATLPGVDEQDRAAAQDVVLAALREDRGL